MTFYALFIAIIFCMVMSIRTLFLTTGDKKRFSMETLGWAINLYATILIGFALIYLLFELQNHSVILDNGKRVEGDFFQQLQTSFYFSAMTMFSVGYGDISPIGIGRMVATIQAFVGYALPVAFVIRTVSSEMDQYERNKR
ncbi:MULTISPECIES: potassium channel family protein [Bacillaceae]|uniref:Potassium channel LctB n=1 Tax=Peribacillus huizhouensis TaxID=1501239 RepID=A0ABR6CUF3_9BACI|nr:MULTISPECIES: potassium channel family protein [Bacillaceae]MBA9028230.1 potassium channel LctB [Peribacillus huizhouensis]